MSYRNAQFFLDQSQIQGDIVRRLISVGTTKFRELWKCTVLSKHKSYPMRAHGSNNLNGPGKESRAIEMHNTLLIQGVSKENSWNERSQRMLSHFLKELCIRADRRKPSVH